jgi:GST-like protein
MESGAILVYLADLSGQLLPTDVRRYDVLQWLMWQMGGFGPMLGQAHHFLRYAKGKAEYAEQRYADEAQRLYGVLDRQLARGRFVAGDEYTIADIAIWPWASRHEWHQVDLHAFPHVLRWYREVAARPAVQRGYDVPTKVNDIPLP